MPPDPDEGGTPTRFGYVRDRLIVEPGRPAGLADRDPAWVGGPEFDQLSEKELKATAEEILSRGVADLSRAQELLWASDTYALLVVFQAIDAAGKDSTIEHVMSGVNPQGVSVVSFRQPSDEELDHDFLWRISEALPERGRIGIFNRSHYEDVLVVRVHDLVPQAEWSKRYAQINAFEREVIASGTRIVKVMTHISKDEQKARLRERLERPDKHYKYNPGDVDERLHWDDYMEAYQVALTRTSTKGAPWYVVPANKKWYARYAVQQLLLDALTDMDPTWPVMDFDVAAELKRLDAS